MEAGRAENVVCPLLIDIRFLLILLVFWSLLASARATAAEQRLALLIGNSAYKSSPLVNSVNDVRLMEGALKEAGDIVQPLASGVLAESDVAGDLFELCRGTRAGRRYHDQITLFKSVGTALEDLAAAQLAFERAR